ncbi:MAG: HNH endonuclease, partial [Proteobacteria bacterium]|nr:HNH endonuclease [Pseudomonadota bacterium]
MASHSPIAAKVPHSEARSPSTKSRKSKSTLAERHAAKTDVSGGVFACWPWTGSVMNANGYGQVSAKSRLTGKPTMHSAHTVAWELANSTTIPLGRIVRHVCHNPLCQNPAHLRLGTNADNVADDKAAGKQRKRLASKDVIAIAKMIDTLPAAAVAKQFKV